MHARKNKKPHAKKSMHYYAPGRGSGACAYRFCGTNGFILPSTTSHRRMINCDQTNQGDRDGGGAAAAAVAAGGDVSRVCVCVY